MSQRISNELGSLRSRDSNQEESKSHRKEERRRVFEKKNQSKLVSVGLYSKREVYSRPSIIEKSFFRGDFSSREQVTPSKSAKEILLGHSSIEKVWKTGGETDHRRRRHFSSRAGLDQHPTCVARKKMRGRRKKRATHHLPNTETPPSELCPSLRRSADPTSLPHDGGEVEFTRSPSAAKWKP